MAVITLRCRIFTCSIYRTHETFAEAKNYDAGLTKPGFMFFPTKEGKPRAFNVNYRPGVVMWYYNGEYLWSQNEPTLEGPGNGFLLVVDANPQEFDLPIAPAEYYQSKDGWTSWEFDEYAQPFLKDSFVSMMCFLRRPAYYSSDVSDRTASPVPRSWSTDCRHWSKRPGKAAR